MADRLNIGEKIKKRRITLGLTQKEVAGSFMTRNMLSIIESGRAMPSVETAEYLSKTLDIPLSYLFSYDENYFFYEKQDKISSVRNAFCEKRYKDCISIIDSLSDMDDELRYIYAFCTFYFGREKLFSGSLASAEKFLSIALDMASKTCYNTSEIRATAPLYISVASNIHSPLLEFDAATYEKIHSDTFDYEFFKYITMDNDYEFENERYRKHLLAKQLLKKYNYMQSVVILKELEESKNKEYDACMLFGVYSDLEIAYKQMGDFENAYRYASKKLSLLSAFKE